MKLIAISGGVDSMVLSFLYKNEDIVLAFVNYNIRKDTNIDQKIVTDFAKKNNLILKMLVLNGEKPIKKNFQNWAREIRYEFFRKLYIKYKCSELLVAHHKDDFLETCLMQRQKNQNKLFYGIRKKTYFKNMNIYRPLLFKFWKDEIYEFANKYKIEYNDDFTNFTSAYTRNKIRNNILKENNIFEKEKMLNEFLKHNESNNYLSDEIKDEYKKWSNTSFNKKFFINNVKNKHHVIIMYINNHFKNIKLNTNIINNVISFIKNLDNNKKYKLNNGQAILKKDNKLFVAFY